jgi:GT2 family glycosyltransferase
MPKVSIITINWKNYSDTIECVESLMRQDYAEFKIFILDNGSNDNSVRCIELWGEEKVGRDFISVPAVGVERPLFDQKVVLLKSPENLGFAGGNNLACQFALKTGADYIWFINNDTVHDSGALSAMVEAAQKAYRAGMICSKVCYFNKPDIVESLGVTMKAPFGIFKHIGQGMRDCNIDSAPIEIQHVYGCSFLVNCESIKEAGFMDERYFILREENDWGKRVQQKGWKLYCAPGSKVWHKVSATIGKRSDTFFYYVTRNTLLFMKDYYPLFLVPTVLSLLPLVVGLILIDTILSERKAVYKRLRMAVLGYLHFFKGKFGKVL